MDYLVNGFWAAFALLANMDDATFSAITATLVSTSYAMAASLLMGLPMGFALGYCDFPGKKFLRLISDTLLAFPTVLIGLLVYAFITYRGPLGEWGLLFTLPGMAIGQTLLALPIVVSPETKDNNFTWKDFQERNNSELVAVYGNFVNRAGHRTDRQK